MKYPENLSGYSVLKDRPRAFHWPCNFGNTAHPTHGWVKSGINIWRPQQQLLSAEKDGVHLSVKLPVHHLQWVDLQVQMGWATLILSEKPFRGASYSTWLITTKPWVQLIIYTNGKISWLSIPRLVDCAASKRQSLMKCRTVKQFPNSLQPIKLQARVGNKKNRK